MSPVLNGTMMKPILFIAFSILMSTEVFAQNNFEAAGDKAFKNKNYYNAAYYYRKAIETYSSQPLLPFYPGAGAGKGRLKNRRPHLYYQIAESYRLGDNCSQAKEWYDKLIKENHESEYPLLRLWYGQCLRAAARFDEALQQLRQFKTNWHGGPEFSKIADNEIAGCNFARTQYAAPAPVTVARMHEPLNANEGDYALIKNAGEYWFTSSRHVKNKAVNSNKLYIASAANGTGPVVVNFGGNENKQSEYGTPSMTLSGKRIYLTVWYKKGDANVLGIYSSDLQNNTWLPLRKLNQNVNSQGHNALQPFVTPDGKRLFFVSDRPGGQGGYDIWVSDLGNFGDPLNAKNLGKTINTPDDEEAPFFDVVHKRLVFSSKGFTGLGGFDLFASYENTTGWSAPANLGYPVNSPKDDLYYYEDPDNEGKFYISSDRDSECCLSLFELNYLPVNIAGKIISCNLNSPLSNVNVSLVDSATKQPLKRQKTRLEGEYVFTVNAGVKYQVKIEKSGYFTKVITPVSKGNNDTLYRAETCLQLFKVNEPILLKNILYDFDKADLRPESKIALDHLVAIMADNPELKVELSSHTDSVGPEGYNLALSQQRAEACVNYILSKGIDKERIYARGYGKSRPAAPNSLPDGRDNPAGRQLNRRTEFTIVNK